SPAVMASDTPEGKPAKAAAAGKAGAKPPAGYSGRFLGRMSGDLHQQLPQAAESEQASPNPYVTDPLAGSVTDEPATRDAPDPPTADHTTAADATEPRNPRRTLRMVLAANLVLVALAGAIAIVLLVLALNQGL